MKINLPAIIIAILCFLFLFLIKDYIFYSSLGIAYSLFIFILFIEKLGKSFPIKEFIILIACLQWIVGAKISYNLGKNHHKYFMYIDEYIYMSYVIPGVIAMSVGLYLIKNNLSIEKIKIFIETNKKSNKIRNTAYTLVIIGILSNTLNRVINIEGLSFIFYLASLLLYVGIGYLIFIFPKYKWRLIIVTLGITLLSSINSGMFHNLLIISSFLGFLIISKRTAFFTKLSYITLGFIFMYMLQIIKQDFREIIWNKNNTNPLDVFYSVIEKEFLVEAEEESISGLEEDKAADANNRLNQGWIISKVMANIPSKKDFLEGETIKEAIEASLLPRFLAPNKAGADKAIINFKEITGLGLSDQASMGLSLIAEFYANYGIVGGWIAMLIYGLLLSLSIHFIIKVLGNNSPIMILWLVLFFFQVVKAETDFIKVFNHLTKSIMFFIIINFGLSILGITLFKVNKKELSDYQNNSLQDNI